MSRVLLNYIYIFCHLFIFLFFFFNDTATTEIYTLSLHDALPISMQRLVENLLDMARLQQGGVHLQREWLPLDEVVGSALRQMRARLGQHLVSTDVPASLPLLQLDALLMERVLVNLLDNAAKYTPAGTPLAISAR